MASWHGKYEKCHAGLCSTGRVNEIWTSMCPMPGESTPTVSRLTNSYLYALKLYRRGECENVRACLNLNETGPLKVSTERAGTLSSAANSLLMIQRSLTLTGAHPSAPLTHTRPPNHPHRHEKAVYSTLTNKPIKQTD